MKTLCSSGHKISDADNKALGHYLLGTPKDWAKNALKWMINKAIKTIRRDYSEIYKSKIGPLPAEISQLIPALIAMDEFKPYKNGSPENESPQRVENCTIEILEGGLEIEDYEDAALRAFYKDPEQTLYDLMENKIAKRKNAFIKENEPVLLNDPEVTEIPSTQDEFIQSFVIRPDCISRAERETVI